jgi:hypothetical protein
MGADYGRAAGGQLMPPVMGAAAFIMAEWKRGKNLPGKEASLALIPRRGGNTALFHGHDGLNSPSQRESYRIEFRERQAEERDHPR